LLEGLVFATRIAETLATELPDPGEPASTERETGLVEAASRPEIQRAMTEGAGVLRSAHSLSVTCKSLDALSERSTSSVNPESWETTNLVTIATALVAAAEPRTETRGCHWREDHPDRDDEHWRVRIVSRLDAGRFVTAREEVPAE
jgi:L-aspartate oxidase